MTHKVSINENEERTENIDTYRIVHGLAKMEEGCGVVGEATVLLQEERTEIYAVGSARTDLTVDLHTNVESSGYQGTLELTTSDGYDGRCVVDGGAIDAGLGRGLGDTRKRL